MTLDPQAKYVLDLAEERGLPPLDQLTPDAAKADYEDRATKLTFRDVPIGNSLDLDIPGPHGAIPIRIYQPDGMTAPLPTLIYYHGGGWVIGSRDTHDSLCRLIANSGPFIVVSVDYRMGPEAPFPAAVDDAITAFNWTHENIADYNGNPEKVAVGGDSAGGNLSAVVALLARDAGGFQPAFQWLIYPATRMEMTSPSHQKYAEGYFLTRDLMRYFQRHYLQNPDDYKDWRASPLLADSLAGLAPALIQTAGFDPLQDEAIEYAARMNREGSKATHTHFPGMIHGFVNLGGVIDAAHDCVKEGVTALQKAFRGS
ncbi:MAG: acetyl hydrolase [Sneathiella sp.]|jgi:acetyl esterase|uniref:alpha/beta hydrolase n=1 Tax=Sneathiella sp. TaxID=1964365 RepID=UPI000C447999|nr:alpha/beta hydrolase [Sneathiella sp.]MAL78495.1 acetyl hydrolase [Sneathiella sp.]